MVGDDNWSDSGRYATIHSSIKLLRGTAVEVMGNLLTVQIIPASIQDRDATQHLLWRLLVT
jgi:hypothetical protein